MSQLMSSLETGLVDVTIMVLMACILVGWWILLTLGVCIQPII
jgi:hypothetical protein